MTTTADIWNGFFNSVRAYRGDQIANPPLNPPNEKHVPTWLLERAKDELRRAESDTLGSLPNKKEHAVRAAADILAYYELLVRLEDCEKSKKSALFITEADVGKRFRTRGGDYAYVYAFRNQFSKPINYVVSGKQLVFFCFQSGEQGEHYNPNYDLVEGIND